MSVRVSFKGSDTDNSSPAALITSQEGVVIREKIWEEILNVLEKTTPDIRSIINFQDST